MKIDSLSPNEIRKIAKDIVMKLPQGVRQKDLVDMILESHDEYLGQIKDPKSKIKSAVWNLDEKFPNEISKNNTTGRNALFLPKPEALVRNASEERILGNLTQEEVDFIYAKSAMRSVWLVLTELESTLEREELLIEDIEGIGPEHLGMLTMDDINTIFEMKHVINSIKRCRELVTNREEIIYWTEDDKNRYDYRSDEDNAEGN